MVEKLGAVTCPDDRSSEFATILSQALPDGADQVFDTRGGTITDRVFENIAKHSRVLIVGRTASNTSDRPDLDPVNMRLLWARETTIHGFLSVL